MASPAATASAARPTAGPRAARPVAVRRTVASAATLLLAVLAVLVLPGTAHAEDGYRYWGYFQQTEAGWEFSQKGAGQVVPQDGSVEGYRFGTSTTSQNVQPRTDPAEVTFEAVCGEEEADAGQKRVAVVIDYGTEADAEGATPPQPRAECAVVAQDATGQQVLEAVADIRSGAVPTCAIDGYPAQGCGDAVTDAQVPADEQPVAFQLPGSGEDAEAAASDEGSGNAPWLLIGVAAVVVVVGVAAFAISRRGSRESAT